MMQLLTSYYPLLCMQLENIKLRLLYESKAIKAMKFVLNKTTT